MDTIFALASAAGKAGVSVIRLSGPDALKICDSWGLGLSDHDRRLVKLRDDDGGLIDEAFAISFAPGRSYTGEQVVEFQTHGSPAVVAAVLNRLGALGGRHAEAGEFTWRAMENGQLDLAQVEGLADLIDSETEGQRRQAVRVFQGALGDLASGWREKLLRAAALLEATIDFVDEDVPIDVFPEVRDLVSSVKCEVADESKGVRVRERVRDGFEVALVGPPNAGKSTLLNRLAGREAAITSDIAGTTRDVLEVRMDLDGLPVTFLDTAGLRASVDKLEEIGIERGKARAATADVVVYLSDGSDDENVETDALEIRVRAKADLIGGVGDDGVSGVTGEGVDRLLSRISIYLQDQVASAGVAIRVRHQEALDVASIALARVENSLENSNLSVDLVAEELRIGIRALDTMIGRVDVENVLGEIFSSFCIGK